MPKVKFVCPFGLESETDTQTHIQTDNVKTITPITSEMWGFTKVFYKNEEPLTKTKLHPSVTLIKSLDLPSICIKLPDNAIRRCSFQTCHTVVTDVVIFFL